MQSIFELCEPTLAAVRILLSPSLFVGVRSLLCNAVLSVLSSFAIILMGKRDLVALF